jgi:lysophospholipase L1-like esterase
MAMQRLPGRWPILLLLLALLCSSAISIPVIVNDGLRSAYFSTMHRQVTKIARPRFVFAGDSLTANGNWGWALARNPFSAVNLAESGALIDQVSLQVKDAKAYGAEFLFVMAGTNDIVVFDRSVRQIAERFEHLIAMAPNDMKLIVTLLPYLAVPAHRDKIRAANLEMSRLSEKKAAAVVDLNPVIAKDEVLGVNYTTDGLHLSDLGYMIWADELRKKVKSLDAAKRPDGEGSVRERLTALALAHP